MGIEPTPSAWKAEVLPLNYTRLALRLPTAVSGKVPAHPTFEQPLHSVKSEKFKVKRNKAFSVPADCIPRSTLFLLPTFPFPLLTAYPGGGGRI